MTKNLSDIPANLAGGAAVTIDPMTTRGDLIVRDATNVTDRLPVGTNGQILKSDGVDVSWDDADSGSGKNYILNPSAAADDTTGVAADAGFSVTRTTTASELPEESVGSAFKISGTGLAPGDKVAFAILASGIDDADGGRFGRAKVSIKDISGTINGEYSIQVYDVTNSVYVGDSDTITGTGTYYLDVPFIAAGDYEFHLLAQTAAPTNIGLSTITIEPVSQTRGAILSDWTRETPSTSDFTNSTGTSINVAASYRRYRREGDSLRIAVSYHFTGPGSSGSPMHYNIGSIASTLGIVYDSSLAAATFIGTGNAYAADGMTGMSLYTVGTPISELAIYRDGSLPALTGTNFGTTGTDTTYFEFDILIPVDGWDNTAPTATDVQYENARMFASSNDGQAKTFGNPFVFEDAGIDTAGGYNNTTGLYTVPVAGDYWVSAAIGTSSGNANLSAEVDGVAVIQGGIISGYAMVSGLLQGLTVGQTIGIASPSFNLTLTTVTTQNYLSVMKVPDYPARKVSLPFSDVADDTKQYLLMRYQKDTVAADNNFSSGNFICSRVGDVVTITTDGSMSHSSASQPATSSGLIPADYRPTSTTDSTYYNDSGVVAKMSVASNGTVTLRYTTWTGSAASRTNSITGMSMTFNIM